MKVFDSKAVRKGTRLLTVMFLCLIFAGPVHGGSGKRPPEFPVPGKATLVNAYTDYCFGCRMLKPVLKKISEDYSENLVIVNLDAQEHRRLVKEMKITAVPVLFFYDHQGHMHRRHEGFMKEEDIKSILEEMGVQ